MTGSPAVAGSRRSASAIARRPIAVIAITVASWLLIALIYVLTKAFGGDPFFIIAGVTGVSTVLLYWAYGVVHRPRADGRPVVARRADLEPWPVEPAARRRSRSIWIILITPLFLYPFPLNPAALATVGRVPRPAVARLLRRLGTHAGSPVRAARAPTPSSPRSSASSSGCRRARDGHGLTDPSVDHRRAGRRRRPARPQRQPRRIAMSDHDHDARRAPPSRRAREMVRDGRIDTIVVAITDMQGRLMGKRVQGQAFLDGVISHGAHFCTYLLGTDMEMNTPEGFRLMNWETGYGDWIAEPVWDQLRYLPWLPGTAMVLADTVDEETGQEIPVSPRTILKRQVAAAADAGFAVKAGSEFEFYVLKDSWEELAERGHPVPERSATTTRTTTSCRRPRPNRSTASCATR